MASKLLACVAALAVAVCMAAPLVHAQDYAEAAALQTSPPLSQRYAELSTFGGDIDTAKQARVERKDEVIYGLLGYDGTVDDAYAVNRFRLNSEGSFNDYGAYRLVENLSNTEPLTLKGDEVGLAAGEGDFYYQGTMEAPVLPWQFAFAYTLDGKAVVASDIGSLAGKSGRLGIHIAARATPGADLSFYEHYTLQITLTLPSNRIENLSAEGATVASAGSNTQLNYLVLPNRAASYDLTVDVTDISMPGISVAAVPFGMAFDMPDTSGISSEMQTLVMAVAELSGGTSQAASGASAAALGLAQLKEGSLLFNSGLLELNAGSDTLVSSSRTLSTNLAAASGGLAQMSALGLFDYLDEPYKTQLLTTIAGLGEITNGYSQLDAGIEAYVNGVAALASEYPRLDDGISQSAAGTRAVSGGLYELDAGVAQLHASIQGLPDEMQRQVDAFAASYDFSGFEPHSFLSKQNRNVQTVQFVLTTPALELPALAKEETVTTGKSSILDKLVALFTGE
jgi:hypothetical protein